MTLSRLVIADSFCAAERVVASLMAIVSTSLLTLPVTLSNYINVFRLIIQPTNSVYIHKLKHI
jgi:hypothetical protein